MNLVKLMDSSYDAIIILDKDDLVVYWNQGATYTFGYTQEEMLGEHLDKIIPKRLRKLHTQAYLKFIETGNSKYAAGHTMAVPALHKNGEQLSIEFRLSIEKDSDNKITFVAAIVRDVTAKRRQAVEQTKKIKELQSQMERFGAEKSLSSR